MKQKLIVLLGLTLLIIMAGSSYMFYVKNQQRQQQLMQSQQAVQKQIADLNDRLVAVARQQTTSSANPNSVNPLQPIRLSPSAQIQLNQQRLVLRQQQRQWTLTALNLAQDSVRQGNTQKAQQLLLELQQNIIESQQDTGDVFNNTLLQALKIDQLNMAQQATRQQQARAALSQSLLQIQQQLNLMAVQAPQRSFEPASGQKGAGIGHWFKQLLLVERATPETGQHMLDRSFIYKQASINVAIARLSLAQSDQVGFSRNLNEAFTQLSLLPDPASRQLVQQVEKVKAQPWPASIELTSLSLLTGQKASS